MTIPQDCLLLRIYIGKNEFSGSAPVYETILWEAKKQHLGATMMAGVMGIGHIGVLQDADNPHNDDLPMVIEAVDSPEKIRNFIPIAAKLLGNHGLIVTSEVKVVHQGIRMPLPGSSS